MVEGAFPRRTVFADLLVHENFFLVKYLRNVAPLKLQRHRFVYLHPTRRNRQWRGQAQKCLHPLPEFPHDPAARRAADPPETNHP